MFARNMVQSHPFFGTQSNYSSRRLYTHRINCGDTILPWRVVTPRIIHRGELLSLNISKKLLYESRWILQTPRLVYSLESLLMLSSLYYELWKSPHVFNLTIWQHFQTAAAVVMIIQILKKQIMLLGQYQIILIFSLTHKIITRQWKKA